MPTLKPQDTIIHRRDYRPPAYLIDQTHLTIDLQPDGTQVSSRLYLRRNSEVFSCSREPAQTSTLVLDGVNLKLISLAINGKVLRESDYTLDSTSLTLDGVPSNFILDCVSIIHPKNNSALVGLYQTQGLYCTHCEPEGFRHITYYLDRPDVLSEFQVTIIADKIKYPILLSNGNLLKQGVIDSNLSVTKAERHWVTWHDPFKKPSYLFAMVAGRLHYIEDIFVTRSRRHVTLRIFAETSDELNQCSRAMTVLQQAMAWDERRYGREYDLDLLMVVVIGDFNLGAMENKGLNIYRADCFLMDPQIATDISLQNITETIGHEYFHNWSGNRVTCRDWFQLSLKEGLTTYRGQHFCRDIYGQAVRRIGEVLYMRTIQFAEDSSPLAHSVCPDTCRAIWNLYTPTVYQKGAELIRMLHIMLGAKTYRQGCDLFFDRYDGRAATTNNFIDSLQEISGRDLSQFCLWYSKAGTPHINIDAEYDVEKKRFTLLVQQPRQLPMNFPLSISLLGQQGRIPLNLSGSVDSGHLELVLDVSKRVQAFVFKNIEEEPVPALFRNFSAPVKYSFDYSSNDLFRLIQKEPDGYCRWEASQLHWSSIIRRMLQCDVEGLDNDIDQAILCHYRDELLKVQLGSQADCGLLAHQLSVPKVAYMLAMDEISRPIDISGLCKARQALRKHVSLGLKTAFEAVYDRLIAESADISSASMSQRALHAVVLDYLVVSEDPVWLEKSYQQYQSTNNMTDAMAALTCLVNSPGNAAVGLKQAALEDFYRQWQHQPVVIDQWLAVQAQCQLPNTLCKVITLLEHQAFDIKNPSRVNALIGNFCNHNPENFHQSCGDGYSFLGDQLIAINDVNPQLASRTLARSPLINWRHYDDDRKNLMLEQLVRLRSYPKLSNELFDVVDKCLTI